MRSGNDRWVKLHMVTLGRLIISSRVYHEAHPKTGTHMAHSRTVRPFSRTTSHSSVRGYPPLDNRSSVLLDKKNGLVPICTTAGVFGRRFASHSGAENADLNHITLE